MKRFSVLCLVFAVFILSAVPAFAADGAGSPPVPSGSVSNYEGTADIADTSLVAAVNSLFGSYEPRTQTVTTYLSDGTTVETVEVIPGLAGLDYAWLASVLLFALALYCIFRMIGGLLKWK